MPPTRPPYPSELKHQIIELVRAGRSPLFRYPDCMDSYMFHKNQKVVEHYCNTFTPIYL